MGQATAVEVYTASNSRDKSPVQWTSKVLLTLLQKRVGGAYQASCGHGWGGGGVGG